MTHHCPECQRVLYSRRLKLCGYCGATIPDSLRFTEEEIAARDEEIERSHEQHRERERAAEEAKAAKRREQSND